MKVGGGGGGRGGEVWSAESIGIKDDNIGENNAIDFVCPQ